jgi:hypothetical protein
VLRALSETDCIAAIGYLLAGHAPEIHNGLLHLAQSCSGRGDDVDVHIVNLRGMSISGDIELAS